jgi:hypothetical protein
VTEFEWGWVIGFFQAKGSYCRTGSGTTFALEAFCPHERPLRVLAQLAGGNVYSPPPAAPSRWTWRLYGEAAKCMYTRMRPYITDELALRGDKKLAECK